ncbi:UDP-N-acetylglucosamine--N-acetylmuramyl-(pentapeptide) pyrophosphoryl-undecaprenol N-acetylglucosamine transferase [Brevibacterium aurantiacum]|uniref:UDP-N-acetylglucosamine--N-acetylmuramyl-(pentapeptide) pyrophosphoryl-undecaprenol N-acetylglucosamine transferase n=2 Tax=Brevibacterium aurantiacum TaxID=273384 RepID=A0A2H1K1M2_BREAU|nr:UDP-N-acetylglucosamine--N-acetylmuramyl-(pentapeptide) pyrophosphoryl-undecaprenol N-acetylglucosamine transferase [Brevibacterium aurantiacum]MDN5549314.1 UDP-N-acetylglucosamine--N-acetylmuramyl-(pentapeptide) pyrophosphoryl-undecaprenol N-acetylglucosamine transferase [Brevibacterium sp.]AZL06138.1 UDP-N-acetylglucosamine--N-acetylmuramyl-(pentapeptide) pyrophosphoryl-undecaprenol N-acetylglucosamine transferase [Brevibacterium aurantiacum]AZL09696.1 UDP-N-acetylglucosamine--N-acetylmuram
MTSILLAGGGTTGHISPMLAIGRELRANHPEWDVFALGTADGLEADIVPKAGFELLTIDKVPMPRSISPAALKFPKRFAANISHVKKIIAERDVKAVVGVGGYVCPPAFIAAKQAKIPLLVHEANAKPGMANRLGAALTTQGLVGVTFPDTKLRNSTLVGMPMPTEISSLDRSDSAQRQAWRADLGLSDDKPVLVVTGGSSGAQRINDAFLAAAPLCQEAGVQVLHITGAGKDDALREAAAQLPDYHVVDYVDGMHRAYAVADLLVARSGAATVSEATVVGVPALYVPLAIGNGEQRLNAAGSVKAGASLLVDNAEFSPSTVTDQILPLVSDQARLDAMSAAALDLHYPTNAATTMATIVTRVLRG